VRRVPSPRDGTRRRDSPGAGRGTYGPASTLRSVAGPYFDPQGKTHLGFNAATGTHGVSSDTRGLAARQIGGPTLTAPVCRKKRC